MSTGSALEPRQPRRSRQGPGGDGSQSRTLTSSSPSSSSLLTPVLLVFPSFFLLTFNILFPLLHTLFSLFFLFIPLSSLPSLALVFNTLMPSPSAPGARSSLAVTVVSPLLPTGMKAGAKPGGTPGAPAGQPGAEGDSVFSKILPGGAAEQAGKLTEGELCPCQVPVVCPRPCRRSWVWGLLPLGPWAGPAGGSWAALASLCPPTPPRREPDASLLSTSQRSLLLAKNSPRSGDPARRGEYELLHPLPPWTAERDSPALGPGVLGSWGAKSGLQREVMWPELQGPLL